ncbi:hypothetical protein ACIQXI_21640 [Lysinibacillus sp. NPDC097195]|uniref:hypothetical protein n=1 Tax=Lysinibacillus sp. NPDC097195 TaxID=3364141 RepID=UPI00382D4F51
MTPREPKNTALPTSKSITDLLNPNGNVNVEVNDNINFNIDFNDKDVVNNEFDYETNIDSMADLKAKMQFSKKKETNKQVTVYLTPKNYKRFNVLKEKGQKSELINQLLNLYFKD